MKIFFGYESALEYWTRRRCFNDSFLSRSLIAEWARGNRARPREDSSPTSRDVVAAGYPDFIRRAPAILVTEWPSKRLHSERAESRIWKAPTMNCFVRIDDTFHVSTPEACFAQLARKYDVVDLTRIGFELCGTYAIVDGEACYGVPPVASCASLERMVRLMGSMEGVDVCRHALKYVRENSASPAETNLAMMLCLPPLRGGYGLPWPTLNKEIEIPERLRAAVGHKAFRCDLYWETKRGKVAVEYKSEERHLNRASFNNDAKRNNALRELGLAVIEVTPWQLYDAKAFCNVARQIAHAMGRKLQIRVKNPMSRRYELRKRLLG